MSIDKYLLLMSPSRYDHVNYGINVIILGSPCNAQWPVCPVISQWSHSKAMINTKLLNIFLKVIFFLYEPTCNIATLSANGVLLPDIYFSLISTTCNCDSCLILTTNRYILCICVQITSLHRQVVVKLLFYAWIIYIE